MSYEDRMKHLELVERSTTLAERLAEGDASVPVTREEARELAALMAEVVTILSPERWDSMMEAVVDEAARRAGSLAPANR